MKIQSMKLEVVLENGEHLVVIDTVANGQWVEDFIYEANAEVAVREPTDASQVVVKHLTGLSRASGRITLRK